MWAEDLGCTRYREAQEAYLGTEIRAWRSTPEAATERWVILSAKYGFLEPDHPIADYDVTFGRPSSGPISLESLRAQVLYQRRWKDGCRLRDFDLVIVHGTADYWKACKFAFKGVAEVRPAGSVPSAVALPGVVSHDACRRVAAALRGLPRLVFENFDRAEPEWRVLELLAGWSDPQAVVAAIGFALCDYKLEAGGAAAYWEDVYAALRNNVEPKSSGALRAVIEEVLRRPVSASQTQQKRARIGRLLDPRFLQTVKGRSFEEIGSDPVALWRSLAETMNQPMHAKTIVFAMKMVDLLHRVRTGAYISFETPLPIVADLRIARVSYSSGIVAPPPGLPVLTAVERAARLLAGNRDVHLDAWQTVANEAGGLNLFRVDSLVWQLSAPIYSWRQQPAKVVPEVVRILRRRGASPETAKTVASALAGRLVAVGDAVGHRTEL